MIMENLQGMSQENKVDPIGVDDPDFIYKLSRKKPTYDDVKMEMVSESNKIEVDMSNFQPESEEALIAYTMDIHKKFQTYSIGGYW